jgi:hypothetical protein
MLSAVLVQMFATRSSSFAASRFVIFSTFQVPDDLPDQCDRQGIVTIKLFHVPQDGVTGTVPPV